MSERPEAPQEPAGPGPQRALKLTAIFVAVVIGGLVVGRALDNTTRELEGAATSEGGATSEGAAEEDDDPPTMAAVGSAAPDFTVELIDGGQFTLYEQLEADDGPVVVNLWASWCVPCREEMPHLSEFADANPQVKVIGVAVDDNEADARRFAEESAPSYDLALGNRRFEVAYPNFGLPATFVIGADGDVDKMWHGMVTVAMLEDLT